MSSEKVPGRDRVVGEPYTHEEEVREGAAFWGLVDREVDKDRERREFIRRAAIAMRSNARLDTDRHGSRFWLEAKALWDSKPEDC